ncbi:calcium/proton exchanger [Rhizopus microsporus var. microsporus]|uniref:Vacuolar calcium ion transporter n=1 Tax=Rhizopus microsporus var. microsporus TaxID=86635 RepID=A0A1X0QND2_RHIZD|nr:calcium/proton exchanger [Rhizopus microsporus var. microsporus]
MSDHHMSQERDHDGELIGTDETKTSEKEIKEPTAAQGLASLLKSSWLNILLICIPFGWASHFVWTPTTTFVLNFIAIIPLAKLLGFATEEIALRTGEVIGGLLNATFGNAVELIISIISLTQNLVIVVQAAMLGSILSNLLLILGMCFLCGGYKHKEQVFNATAAQTSASLLFISVVSLLLPAAFYGSTINTESEDREKTDILDISRGTAIILLIIYFAYLFFQFLQVPVEAFKIERRSSLIDLLNSGRSQSGIEEQALSCYTDEDDDEEESPSMPWWMAITVLVVVTVLVAISGEFLVSAIESVVQAWQISETFVGLILLPIVANAAEHVTAVTVAWKNKMDLALGVSVGSSMQIALLVTPIMVIIGWGINVDMSLFFNIYETAVLFASVVMVNYLIMGGKSHWFGGLMLCAVYVIIAISFYYYPDAAAGGLDGPTLNVTIAPSTA